MIDPNGNPGCSRESVARLTRPKYIKVRATLGVRRLLNSGPVYACFLTEVEDITVTWVPGVRGHLKAQRFLHTLSESGGKGYGYPRLTLRRIADPER